MDLKHVIDSLIQSKQEVSSRSYSPLLVVPNQSLVEASLEQSRQRTARKSIQNESYDDEPSFSKKTAPKIPAPKLPAKTPVPIKVNVGLENQRAAEEAYEKGEDRPMVKLDFNKKMGKYV